MTWIITGSIAGSSIIQTLAKLNNGDEAEKWVKEHGSGFDNLYVHNDIVLPTIIEEKK